MYFDRRLWSFTAGLRGRIALGIVLGLAALAVGIARFALLGLILAQVFAGGSPRSVLLLALGTVGLILLRAVLDHGRDTVAHGTATAVQERLRIRLHDHIARLGPAWFAGERTGGVMLSLVDGVEHLQSFFGQYLPTLATAAVAPFAIFAFMAAWDMPVAAVLLVAALFALIGPIAVHMKERRASLAQSAAFKAFGEEFLDAVQGLPTLKALGQSGTYGERLAERARALAARTVWVLGMSVMTRGITDLGTALGAALALTLGAWRVSHGDMTLPALLVVLMAGTEIFRPLRDLRGVLHRGMLGQAAATRINALLDAKPALSAAQGGAVLPDAAPAIAFDAVRFSYGGSRRAAHDGLSFAIAPGETVGIVGPSGAGKSSIIRLLLREHDPQSGTVRIGGHDVRTLDPESLRARIAVVAQDAALFHGTIAENLRLGHPDATEAEMAAAARAAEAHDFITALPDGYDTLIGERGARLSGGQRQRLAIARALLRDAPVLVLDEALSAVDAANEASIQRALNRLMLGRTTLILAHRLSSVIDADRILVLEGGQVAEAGTHAALMAQGGLYRQLMGAQAAEWGAASGKPVLLPQAGPASGAHAEPGEPTDPDRPPVRPIDADAAEVGWAATLATLLRFIRPWRGSMITTTLLGIGRVAAFIGVGALGALLIADVRAGAPTGLVLTLLLTAAPVAALLHWLESWLAHVMAYGLLAEMRIELFAKLDRLAPAYLLRRRSGDLVALAAQDIETVEYFFAHTVAPAIVAVLVPGCVLIVLAVLAWPLALVLLPFLAWAMWAPFRGRDRIDRLGGQARGALGAMAAHVAETVQGLADLLSFGAMGRRRDGFVQLAQRAGRARLSLLHDLSQQSAMLEATTALGGLAVAVAGAWLTTRGALAPGLLPLLVLVATAAFMPVSEIAQVGRQLADTIAATRRLHVVQREPEPVTDGPEMLATPDGVGAAITFDAVSFTYPGAVRPALDGIAFDIPAGATVALVGTSGAGKTTVANLLLRFWDPETGRVTIDGTDLRALNLDSLRRHVALVAQDTYLFNDTLENNVRLARPEASPAQIEAAIDRAALRDFVAALPDGLATRVGERGVQLSGGQRQRVAIARAFLKDAPVLVLDEATSHLDAISEAQIRGALDRLMRRRTTLVIAHRLSTVQDADLILVLGAGRVLERGTHAELLHRGGVYARLIAQQVGGMQEAGAEPIAVI